MSRAISACVGNGSRFDQATEAFSGAYADQVQRDFEAFTAAIAESRVTAVEDAAGGEGLLGAQAAATPTASPPRRTQRTKAES